MMHILAETNRHAGYADMLCEQLDGDVGTDQHSSAAVDHDAGHWADGPGVT